MTKRSHNHRHTSHLLGLYPFDQISARTDPELARAVRTTLDRRMNRKNWKMWSGAEPTQSTTMRALAMVKKQNRALLC